jgi:hypothetical protein
VTTDRSSWPAWTNPEIILYHGTVGSAAQAICAGVDLSFGEPRRDFGKGFYTTTWERQAREWAQRKVISKRSFEPPVVVKLTLDRNALSQLSTLAFVRGARDAQDYWKCVSHCRRGLPHRPGPSAYYDVVYGPVAAIWGNPLHCYTIAKFDQVSFHTAAAQLMLNEVSICSKEIVP